MAKNKFVNYDGYNCILKSAENHGRDSEPDHEVGDLQDALSIAWELLDEKGRQTLVERFFDEVALESLSLEDQQSCSEGS